MHFSDVEIGKQLIVGEGTYYDCLGLGRKAIRGSAYIEGPFLLGDARSFSEKVLATAMIARDVNSESNNPPRSLHVKGNTRLEGDDGTPNALNITGNTKQVGNVERTGDENATGKITASSTIKASNFVGDISTTSGTPPGCKLFDIPHPSKKGYRLAHACVEGPEIGVYCRGRIKNDKIILLPDYWKDLVNIDTITVQLQPIGAHQDVIVRRWDAEKVELQTKSGIPINCFYHIFAERKDINELVVEYKGESPDDYPGDNSQYSIAGYHYDTRN